MQHAIRYLALAAATAMLAGCGTVSRDIASDGRGAGEIVFPPAAGATLEGGTFVNLDNLRQVAPGMNKDQLYDLLGRPHFHEGVFNVREWDYLFDFRTGDGDGFVSCQYKVLFDTQGLARSFHWKPADCAGRLEVASAPVAPATPRPAPRTLSLSADALFGFDSAELAAGGHQRLDQLLADFRGSGPVGPVEVTGHSDRIGDAGYNLALSRQRAEAVRDYLVAEGLAAGSVTAVGLGEQLPLVQCDDGERSALIACLAPNRRVEVKASAPGTPAGS